MPKQRVFQAFFQARLKEIFTYRGTIVLWIITWIISFMSAVFIWRSAKISGTLAGYTLNKLITYYFIGMLVWAVAGWYCFNWVAESIKNGELTNYILKPINFFWTIFAGELAWHVNNVFFFIFFFLATLFFSRNYLVFDFNFFHLLLFIFSLVIASLVTFEFNIALAMLAFWLTNYYGLGSFYWLMMSLLGGQIMPLSFFPQAFQPIIQTSPFRFMYSFPIEVYLGQLTVLQQVLGFGLGIFWVVVCYWVYKFLWQKGLKTYTAFGR